MARATGVPTGRALGGITAIIRNRSRAVTVTRPTKTTDSLDQETETTTDFTEQVWLHEPSEAPTQEIAGERVNGDLNGLFVADGNVDIQRNDRITHGGIEYDVDTVVGYPVDDDTAAASSPDTDFWMVGFVRRQ